MSPSDKSLWLQMMGLAGTGISGMYPYPETNITLAKSGLEDDGFPLGWLLHGMCHLSFRECSTQKAQNDAY